MNIVENLDGKARVITMLKHHPHNEDELVASALFCVQKFRVLIVRKINRLNHSRNAAIRTETRIRSLNAELRM